VDRVLERISGIVAVILFTILLTVGGIQIFGRYFFRYQPSWTNEVMLDCLYILGWLTASMTARHNGHVSVDILQEKIKNVKIRKALFIATRFLIVIFAAVMIPFGIDFTLRFSYVKGTTITFLPMSVIYITQPIGMVMLIVTLFAHTLDFTDRIVKEKG
jgi:TRAP-type C4-dicarboxylate transport system permease small subunit